MNVKDSIKVLLNLYHTIFKANNGMPASEEELNQIVDAVSTATVQLRYRVAKQVCEDLMEEAICPSCDKAFADYNAGERFRFCPHCGQALDWPDQED